MLENSLDMYQKPTQEERLQTCEFCTKNHRTFKQYHQEIKN